MRGNRVDKFYQNTPFRAVFDATIKLYKARHDPALAARIASELAVDGAVEYASWPIRIAKFWMIVGIISLTLFAVLFLWLGFITHWVVAIPAGLSGGLIYGITRIWRGLNAGTEHVSTLAKTQLGTQLDRFKADDTPLDK